MTKRSNREEGGYALLLVLLLAAGIAISLYMEMPRIAFETQRNREEMVVDRGEQYKRAIQLFVRANKRYPSKIEDLESFNDKRYLRHRFINPMTGKDDWRLVHVGPNGMLTDSLVKKNTNPLGGKDDKNTDQTTTASNTTDSSAGDPNAQPAGWDAKRQRPSDVTQLTSTGTGTGLPPGADVSQQPGYIAPQPQYPGQPQYPQQPGQFNPAQPYPGQTYPGQPVQPGQPGQPFPGQVPGQPGQPFPVQQFPGQPGQPMPGQPMPGQPMPGQPMPGQPMPGQQPMPQYPGQPVGGQPLPGQMYPAQPQYPGQPPQYPGQMQPGQPYPGQIQPGQPYPGQQMPGQTNIPPPAAPTTGGFGTPQSNAGINAVRDQIFGGSRGSAFNNNPQQGGLGTGIAGVGVPAEIKGEGIMVIKERSKYREWEFIYDPKRGHTCTAPAGQSAAGPLPIRALLPTFPAP